MCKRTKGHCHYTKGMSFVSDVTVETLNLQQKKEEEAFNVFGGTLLMGKIEWVCRIAPVLISPVPINLITSTIYTTLVNNCTSCSLGPDL